MAGPNHRRQVKTVIPLGEAQVLFSPDLLAKEVRNLVRTDTNTLRSIRGPAVWEPNRGGGYPLSGIPHGIWHGTLLGGNMDDTLLVRTGTTLSRFTGYTRGFQSIKTGLTNEKSPRFPDQFVQMSNKVIWFNGIDRPLVITHDGLVTPLGFVTVPAPPITQGPLSPERGAELSRAYPNTRGYAWPGRIGTVGDDSEGQSGAVLAGEWLYFQAPEDIHGNVGPSSVASAPVYIRTITADPYKADGSLKDSSDSSSGVDFREHGYEIDDLTKQFRVMGDGDHADDHCVAWHLYRTPDARNAGNQPQFVARFPGRRALSYSDSLSDAELGAPMLDLVPVPVFRVACVHQGCLIIGNTTGDPGLVRKSLPGFGGMFQRLDYVYPDSGGAEVTGMASHGGRLIVFTETAVYDCTDFRSPFALAEGIGCVAPGSIAAHPTGLLIWLSRDGFYGLSTAGELQKLSANIDHALTNDVSRTRMPLAVADINADTNEYVCFLSPAGSTRNTLGFVFGEDGFRRLDIGVNVTGLTRTRDFRQYLLAIGSDPSVPMTSVFVLDRETPAYTAANKKTALFKSANLYGDDLGLYPVHVHDIYLGLVDAYEGTATIRCYRNGESTPDSTQTFSLMGPDGFTDQAGTGRSEFYRDAAGRAVVGTAVTHDKRLTWRVVPVNLRDATVWRFEIEVAYPALIELAAFAFTIGQATNGLPPNRLPKKDDT